jgi:hypothetical protein
MAHSTSQGHLGSPFEAWFAMQDHSEQHQKHELSRFSGEETHLVQEREAITRLALLAVPVHPSRRMPLYRAHRSDGKSG